MAYEFLDVTLRVRFGSFDHCEAITSPFEDVWPGIRIINCWPHLVRQAKAKRNLLKDVAKYDTLVKPHMKLLRPPRSHKQFVQLCRIVTDEWVMCDEHAFANWFRVVYLRNRWERWHISGPDVAGIIPSQQGIEAHQGAMKRTCLPHALASTTGVTDAILPRVVKAGGRDLCPAYAAHFCEGMKMKSWHTHVLPTQWFSVGPVPPDMLMKASRLCKKDNFRTRFEGRGPNRHVAVIVFNSSRHMMGGGLPNGVPVDAARAKRFEKSLVGEVAGDTQARELQFELLSMHRVTIARGADEHPLQLAPFWSFDVISTIHEQLQCTSHVYVRTGWVYSHVLASLSLMDRLDLEVALQRLPVCRAPGRPPARSRALVHDDPHEGYFKKRNLVRLFTQRREGTSSTRRTGKTLRTGTTRTALRAMRKIFVPPSHAPIAIARRDARMAEARAVLKSVSKETERFMAGQRQAQVPLS